MTFIAANDEEQHALEDLESYRDDWLQTPDVVLDQTALFRLLVNQISGTKSDKLSTAYKAYAFETLVNACHFIRDKNIDLHYRSSIRLIELLGTHGYWKRLVERDEEYLLAAIALTVYPECMESDLIKDFDSMFKEWSGQEYQLSKLTHREVPARILFGDAWTLLYEAELNSSFSILYETLNASRPDFTFRKTANNAFLLQMPLDLNIC